jgi:DNA invertase Pin-like site-specific DNA recombinase
MTLPTKVTPEQLRRGAYLYVRQSTLHQVQENRESTARQYDLQRRAQTLGWNREQITVIDDDLGLSGASATARSGFQRLVADVGLGRVGVVMGLEASRLARNSADWHRLLEICALADTLILDEDGVYDPSHFNDRLLLGLHGMMSEAELYVLRARLVGGQLNKARRGELKVRPPIGYVYDRSDHLVLDPDEQIQKTVRLFFETFRRTGAAGQVVQQFRREGVLWPRRLASGPRAGDIVFAPLVRHRVLQMLHNPRYTGAFVWGRTRQRKIVVGGQTRFRRLPREEWQVLIPNAAPAYITWDEYQTNQAILRDNAAAHGGDRKRSPARDGAALLQGLALCGGCGGRMTVRYHGDHVRAVPYYVCQRRGIEEARKPCQVIPGTGLDEAVGRLVLDAVTPAAVDVALEGCDELRRRRAEVDRVRRAHVERAREEAELAQRQFLLVRPEHRLVADNLERQWNEKLAALARAEEEYARAASAPDLDVSTEAQAHIRALVSDLPQVWNHPRTSMRDRKRILRLLIEDVTLRREGKTLHIHLRWKGGATASLDRPLPPHAGEARRTSAVVVEQVRALATEHTDGRIAEVLNARSLRSGTGQPFTRMHVHNIRHAYGIASFAQGLRSRGWLDTEEMAARLGVHRTTAIRFALEGVLRAIRANDKGDILFEPPTGPLPKAHQGKRFRDRRRYPQCALHTREGV